jgi:hypothetical protein
MFIHLKQYIRVTSSVEVFRTQAFYVHYIGDGTFSVCFCVTGPQMAWNKVETFRIFLYCHNTTVKGVSTKNFPFCKTKISLLRNITSRNGV